MIDLSKTEGEQMTLFENFKIKIYMKFFILISRINRVLMYTSFVSKEYYLGLGKNWGLKFSTLMKVTSKDTPRYIPPQVIFLKRK